MGNQSKLKNEVIFWKIIIIHFVNVETNTNDVPIVWAKSMLNN
jgi:hypothetical protein